MMFRNALIYCVLSVCIVFVAYGASMVYRGVQYRYDMEHSDVRRVNQALAELSASMILPSMSPTTAVVKDNMALKQTHHIFANAQQGDVVFMYPDQIIIFDGNNKKIRTLMTLNEPKEVNK